MKRGNGEGQANFLKIDIGFNISHILHSAHELCSYSHTQTSAQTKKGSDVRKNRNNKLFRKYHLNCIINKKNM